MPCLSSVLPELQGQGVKVVVSVANCKDGIPKLEMSKNSEDYPCAPFYGSVILTF